MDPYGIFQEWHPLPRGTRRRLGLLRLGGELLLVEPTPGHAGAAGTALRLHPAAALLHLGHPLRTDGNLLI